jgi:hypothetical protein
MRLSAKLGWLLKTDESKETPTLAKSAVYDDMIHVTLVNDGYSFFMDRMTLWAWLKSLFPGFAEFDEYGEICEDASDRYWALIDEASKTDDDADLFETATSSVLSSTAACVSQGNTMKKCLDFFIAWPFAGPLNGDNRGADPDAPYSASRVQLYLDLDSSTGWMYLNSSSVNPMFNPYGLIPPVAADTAHSYATIYSPDDTTRVLEMKAYNGYCKLVPADNILVLDALCPPIDANVRWVKRSGEWVIPGSGVVRDKFPSLTIYDQGSDGQWNWKYQSDETWMKDLWTKRSTANDMRAQASVPPGCWVE